jgi:hypothetical protein
MSRDFRCAYEVEGNAAVDKAAGVAARTAVDPVADLDLVEVDSIVAGRIVET